MTKREIAGYVQSSFLPITLAMQFEAIEQAVEEAIRWYDREGGERRVEQFTYNGGNVMTLPSYVDQVVQVYPDRVVTEIFTAQTLLLGVTILDYDIETLALKQNHLKDLRSFLASRFRWWWIKPYLHVDGLTTTVNSFMVDFLYHFDVTSQDFHYTDDTLDWVYKYARALVKQREGRILRMATIIQAPLDGAEMVKEGEQEAKDLQERIENERSVLSITRTP